MKEILFTILLLGFFASLIFIAICCGKLLTFNGSYDDGVFYIFSKNKKTAIKDARWIGKIVLFPILLYTLLCETIAIIVTIICLALRCVFIYILNKNISFKQAFSTSFNCTKYLTIDGEEKYVSHTFMGYQWNRPYVNTDIEW